MTTANGDTWSRDPIADANPDLTRKRLRLSEETEISPRSSDDSILIEALPPDSLDSGDSIDNAIELEDDELLAMNPLSQSFELYTGGHTPAAQLKFLHDKITGTSYITVSEFVGLAEWLDDLVADANGLAPLETQRKAYVASFADNYLADQEFFSALACVLCAILECQEDLFEGADVAACSGDRLCNAVAKFIAATTELALRMIHLLPDVVDSAVSRRDSGQINQSRQSIDWLNYVRLLHRLVLPDISRTLKSFQNHFYGDARQNALAIKRNLLRHEIRGRNSDGSQHHETVGELNFLFKLLDSLTRHHREITNTWETIDCILRISKTLNLRGRAEEERIVRFIHTFVLPVVSEKHPRALPEGFHEMAIETAENYLYRLLAVAEIESAARIYDQFVRADEDALLYEPKSQTMDASALQALSKSDMTILARLLTTAWSMQALKQFIYSEIMDVRNFGIGLLGLHLVKLYDDYSSPTGNHDHPVLQYAARYMRANELTKYIFGPNSHASLVTHSQRIIGFLAATSSFTNVEIDIIWHACTNSVEAEFLKASIGILTDLCRFLDLDQLLYLAKKFTVTPPSKLSQDAIESLTDVFHKIDLKSDRSMDQERRLATAFVSIDILLRIDSADRSACILQLRETAVQELKKFTQRDFDTSDRLKIYERCVPNIAKGNGQATASIDILALFLQNVFGPEESEALSTSLDVSMLVEELGRYLADQKAKANADSDYILRGIASRIDVIMRLMAICEQQVDDRTMQDLFRYALGDLALSNIARDHTWTTLSNARSKLALKDVAEHLLNRFLTVEATFLPGRFITPGLVQLFATSLYQEVTKGSFSEDFSSVLDTVVWRKLLETAESTPTSTVTKLAADRIMAILFNYSQQEPALRTAAKCHAKFARRQLDCIFADLGGADINLNDESRVVQQITLLHSITMASKQNTSKFSPPNEAEICLAPDNEEALRSTIQIYGSGQSHPRLCYLRTSKETLLSELANALPSITGAAENRVIVGGKVLDLVKDADSILWEKGVEQLGVISVCPRHSIHSDLAKVLTPVGTVEYEVLSRYDEIEKLLDGPDHIAQKIFIFLDNMTPPPQARHRVVSESISVEELCPPDRLWRSIYYLHVMYRHLMDFANIGVVDGPYIARGVRLISDILCDDSRPLQLDLHLRCMDFLTAFLQERPLESDASTIVECPAPLISRIIALCYEAAQRPIEDLTTRRLLTERGFKLLQQVLRRQPSAWSHFMDDSRINDLHARLIFDQDAGLATAIMTMIDNFCKDVASPEKVADFFFKTVLNQMQTALTRPDRAELFFEMTKDLLLQNQALAEDEAKARDLTTSLIDTLSHYHHSEVVDYPVLDTVMAGLVQLLTEAVSLLKSFKKPINLSGLCARLYANLLFPAQNGSGTPPLVHPDTRARVLKLVRLTCETREDFASLLEATIGPLRALPNEPRNKYPGRSQFVRAVTDCSGLTNLGMTCYMNSLLQQLFANVHFRRFLFQIPIVDAEKQELLRYVQDLFARMQDSADLAMDTTELAKVLGIQTDSQEDVHGFYADFLSRLESNMPDDQSRLALGQFYTGKLITQIKGECGHVSPRTEPFVDLPIVVKNKSSFHESLQEFVQGEPMEGANQYKCSKCDETNGGRLVNAMRRSCPEEMPDNLTFCLKRFTFEAMLGTEGKVNDRFVFPQTIDMSHYCRAHLDDPAAPMQEDIFELVGVIVHQGTLQLGHYWSYTLLRNTSDPSSRVWVRLEDRTATTCVEGIDEVQRECFGGTRYSNGNERVDNAYVLFYQRKVSLEEQLTEVGPTLDPVSKLLIPAKVNSPQLVKQGVHEHNIWRNSLAQLFDDDFHMFVKWLLETYKIYRNPSPARSSESPESGETPTSSPSENTNNESANSLVESMSRVFMGYLGRVAVCDPTPIKKTSFCTTSLSALMSEEPTFAKYLLDELCQDPHWLLWIMYNDNKDVRSRMVDFFLKCVAILHEQDLSHYAEIFTCFRQALSVPLAPGYFIAHIYLEDYLKCVAGLARLGREETISILEDGYFSWALGLLEMPWTPMSKKKYPNFVAWFKKRCAGVAAPYDFILALLKDNVDSTCLDQPTPDSAPRKTSENGVLLRESEVQALVKGAVTKGLPTVPFWMRTSNLTETINGWTESSPGKLFGYLVSNKADATLHPVLEKAILKYIEDEEDSLPSILHLVLNFCYHSEDQESVRGVWQKLVQVILMWDNCEGEFLQVLHDAFEMIPINVVSTMDIWLAKYLFNKAPAIRDQTQKWLGEDIFKQQTFGKNFDELDGMGVRPEQARKLVKTHWPVLENAFVERKMRNRYESAIRALQHVEHYLRALRAEVKARLASDDLDVKKTVTIALRTEYDESSAVMQTLERMAQILPQWQRESTVPIITNAAQSIEIDSDDDMESDDDAYTSDGNGGSSYNVN
ncbi:Ubiquitin carboxyl-terminal hydrolase puf [Pseudocercospora fuligena]|uniref:Ubiquitin carboxyl-terminal hydrolase puf n=1 Tax=Pseudocercospora fuligena TaxID=685502 RepID=A0A8H6VJZ2_9PEZI|nr:Ubiquitin carboxyl-terminal hydrolase puf [Pseudocercospora fuligena]